MRLDIRLNSLKGYPDISFDSKGDLATTEGLETAILMSILCEQRADETEIAKPELRSGHWTNELNDDENYEVGSKLWFLRQSRFTEESADFGEDEIIRGLQWMLDDGICDDIDVSYTLDADNQKLIYEILMFKKNDLVHTYYYDAYRHTVEGV